MKSKQSTTKKTERKGATARKISKQRLDLSGENFIGAHWDLAHALLNNEINPNVANAFATQTSRILGFKKLEIDRARLIGEKLNGKLLLGK